MVYCQRNIRRFVTLVVSLPSLSARTHVTKRYFFYLYRHIQGLKDCLSSLRYMRARHSSFCVCALSFVFLCLSACERLPPPEKAFIEEGHTYWKKGLYNDAIHAFQQATSSPMTIAEAYLNIALIYDESLHDMSNAIHMYRAYLMHETRPQQRAQAERWLAEATHAYRHPPDDATHETVAHATPETDVRHARHFDLLRAQLAEEYDARIIEKDAQLTQAHERIRALQEELTLLNTLLEDGEFAALTAAHRSNVAVITELRTHIHSLENDIQDARKGHTILQSLVTNLQAEIAHRDAALQDKELAYSAATTRFAHIEMPARETVTTTHVVHTATPIYASLTNRIATLERQLSFRNQERGHFRDTIAELRNEIAQREAAITSAHAYASAARPEESEELRELRRQLSRQQAETRLAENRSVTLTQEYERLREAYAALREEYERIERPRTVASTPYSSREQPAVRGVDTAPAHTVRTPPPVRRTYVVQSGDSLSRIAQTVYGNPNEWRRIYSANRDLISHPNQLRVGMVLVIPE